MSGIKEIWEKERLSYQKRYADYARALKERESNAEIRGHLHECSYVLIKIFGLTSRQVEELEKFDFCGLTQADIDNE